MTEWVITGVGMSVEQLESHLDKKKLAHVLFELFPDNEDLAEIIAQEAYDTLDVEDYVGGVPFENLAELLAFCDYTDVLISSYDGEGNSYLYYPPTMPWQRVSDEPDSVEDVHRRIIKAIQTVTNLSDEEIDKMIDDELYVAGSC